MISSKVAKTFIAAGIVLISLLLILSQSFQQDKAILVNILMILLVMFCMLLISAGVYYLQFKKPNLIILSKSVQKKIQQDLQEDHLTYDRLSQAEQRLQAIVNLIPHAISVKDKNGKIILANQSYADIFGLRRRDIIGMHQDKIQPENEELTQLKLQDAKVLENYQVNTIETWMTNYQKQKKLYEITKVPAIDPVLDEPVVLGIYMDTTEHFYKEQLLHARSRVLESIAESNSLVKNMMLLISEMENRLKNIRISVLENLGDEFGVLASSPVNEDLLNHFNMALNSNVDFINRHPSHRGLLVIKPRDLFSDNQQLQQVLTDEGINNLWIKMITDSNENKLGVMIFWSDDEIAPTPEQLKDINESSLLTTVAIRRFKIEQQLKHFNDVIETSQSAIFLLNSDGKVSQANHAFERVFGVSAEKMNNQPLSVLKPEGDLGLPFDEIFKAVKNSRLWRGKITICKSKDRCMVFQATVSPSTSNENNAVVFLDDISDMEETRDKLESLSFYDSVTGLHNRGLFFERLQQNLDSSKRTKTTLGLILLDLDLFKKINDTVGHQLGDEVLKEIANRIVASVRKEDIVARIDGDEFAVVIRGFKSPNILRNMAQKLMQEISKPLEVGGNKLFITCSVGIGIGPKDSDNASELVRHVELALYRAKINGRNQFEFYEFELNRLLQQRLSLESEMREGLAEGQFFLMFQPIVDSNTKKIIAAEALMRWKNPVRGLVSPMEFIPIAEETGLIKELGELAFKLAIEMIQKLGDSAIKIRVNLSAKQLSEGNLAESIASLLSENNISSHLFGLELTESLLMERRDDALIELNQLQQMGISIAIDDFGTGYSSLSYLKTFPIDTLKIDRSFIRDLEIDENDRALVDAILAIASKLQLSVIAEGVETVGQLEILNEMKSAQLDIQGFLFSKPLLAEALLEQIAADLLHENIIAS
ncbi:MAG TPA: EAL domain-containing protein [Aeromonadales bacterium]|nr:EAL domain-containing protein [Aeromonadales bacterium]